ncbi:class I mannose-6-phosphate isomerase [Chitinophaga sp. GCM10012297]|uniref:Class I mannose-6-phosphate isomerase n=1 Tax=Chitinophaga chungangae TaxID=2821488 RepID=A0ABS3YFM2_9BACT|nr:class I mannose-6-phosphate isomerase [Chitinophaga chungangae]MBO9153454.1 class I mannose-6-phosphate isomerase [Chitinophaga chungangae]
MMPQQVTVAGSRRGYDINPFHSLAGGKIFNGYASLAEWIKERKSVRIDGFVGVFWKEVRQLLDEQFRHAGLSVKWTETAGYLKPSAEIEKMVAPYIGTPGSVWGTKAALDIGDFFLPGLAQLSADAVFDINIVIGTGAALVKNDAPLIYLDLPKNELQYRMKAGTVLNLGASSAGSSSEMYKRFYFVDWVVLNEHKCRIVNEIAVIGDAQWKDSLNWMAAGSLKQGMQKLSGSVFRVKPWFEPGAWGGQWMKERIDGLDKNEVNYAWSFELIVPENGLVFESGGWLLEVSFDFLMFLHYREVLGKHAETFKYEFPVRFDFLDTWEGGNLSIQCHPSVEYIRQQFGENFTQDETYYILDAKADATVYLGFQENIDAAEFRQQLEQSKEKNQPVDIERYVQCFKAAKHELYLIPNGTVHSAGKNNLVLEISATPYIFTFKMYDWLRLDLNGEPRSINIEHAFNNLRFERKGEKVRQELISHPVVLQEDAAGKVVHLPTHKDHYYDVHRLEFDRSMEVNTDGSFHVLMLVEGESVSIETANGVKAVFSYAETFVVPAAAVAYRVTNNGGGAAKLVKAFLKDTL